jgi:hypothetical protein
MKKKAFFASSWDNGQWKAAAREISTHADEILATGENVSE